MDVSSDSSDTIILPLNDEPSDTEVENILRKYSSTSSSDECKQATHIKSNVCNVDEFSDEDLIDVPLIKRIRKDDNTVSDSQKPNINFNFDINKYNLDHCLDNAENVKTIDLLKMKTAIIALALFCAVLAAPVENDDAFQELVDGNHVFTAAVYKEVIKKNTGNLVVSPFSVETVLALTSEGTKGDTASELITGLSLPSTKEKIEAAYQSFLPKLKSDPDSSLTVSIANKIYVEDGVELTDTFASVAADVYGSGVEHVPFEDSVSTAAEINDWVEEQTNHKIQNLISSDDIGPDTQIVLVNALYLSGSWRTPFVKYPTMTRKFFTAEKNSVEIEVLHNEEEYAYYANEELDAKFIEMPLKGGDVSFVVVLPNQIDGLANLEQNLEEVLAPQPFGRERVLLELPKFSIESQIEFIPILESLGIHKLFSPVGDLTGFTSSEGLYVSDVFQKAFINVTESGIEAAAATNVIGTKIDLPTSASFRADHPFLYYIKQNGVTLFFGRYVEPNL